MQNQKFLTGDKVYCKRLNKNFIVGERDRDTYRCINLNEDKGKYYNTIILKGGELEKGWKNEK